MIWYFLSCAGEPELPPSREQKETVSPRELRRISIALTGTLPPIEDYTQLAQDEDRPDAMIERYLDNPRHENRMKEIFSEWLLTRTDHFNLSHEDYHLPESERYRFLQSVGEEAPRLMAYYAVRDEAWTSILTSPYTMADDLLLDIWPLETISDSQGWRLARYTDERPAGGVIMSNSLWWRYYTTPNNFNRSRASALSQLFLCSDYLSRPIQFSAPALLEHDDLNTIIRTNESCIGCHNTLDPIAAALFGFWWYDIYDTAELSHYHAEREFLGEQYLQQEMAWFGTPLYSPAALGDIIALDPRFSMCTVQRMSEFLWHRSAQTSDFSVLKQMEKEFYNSDFRFSILLKSIVSDPNFYTREQHLVSGAQLASIVEELTGFQWEKEGVNLLETDRIGFRKMLGGVDGKEVTSAAQSPSLSRQLTLKRFTQAAARHWISQQNFPDTLNQDWNTRYEELHLRLYAMAPTTERTVLDQEYWSEIHQESSSDQAWESLLSVMFRDPAFWSY